MMKRILLCLALVAGCAEDGGPIQELCDAWTETCNPDGNPDACFQEWALYGRHVDHDDCATGYLIGRKCQLDNGCEDPRCGEPYDDMIICVELGTE